jgi:ubiquinone/menaquinone biosynthesis C-methylase UbiE
MTSDRYVPGYGASILAFMEHRTAESHAAFFLPHLKRGWRVLDAGCGPGTITLGLVSRVAPGSVIGVDVEDSQFAKARERAEDERLNVEYRRASIYELPFDDASFDAVFCHAVLQHLSKPVEALVELRRVLKPGGVIGIRAGDMGGTLVDAESDGAARAVAAYLREKQDGAGDPYIGRKLGRLLAQAGFAVERITASYDVLTEALRAINPSRWSDFAPAAAELRSLNAKPDDVPFIALAWCEAVASRL